MSKLYLGVDIAKETHFAAMTNQQGEILLPPFPFTNDNVGFNEFLEKVKPFFLRMNVLLALSLLLTMLPTSFIS